MGFYFIRMNKISLSGNLEKVIATIFKLLIIKFSLLKICMRIIFSLITFILFSFVSFILLKDKYIDQNHFVILIIFSAIVSAIIAYFDEVQELSIGGNIVKLKEAKKELQVTIDQLKSIKVSTYRMLLLKSLHSSGGFGSSHLVDSRAEYFFSLINEIKQSDCFNDLKSEIQVQLTRLLIDQLNKFYPIFHDKQFNDSDEFPKPTVFYIDLKNEIIDKVHQNRTPVISFDQKKAGNCRSY
ncbi:hypothetical protein ABNIH4_20004 [Acinetobacter baumannii ABNIH4]|uniref:hypothetical protein n=1 Tax=Acinetobacter baumannii TaxID=470 RepID=UPI00021B7751|nr:hypothetical protein [Acinetobacter baumannii]EGT98455.1 hypothetical protein ABNIH4_20004 [Acinetobacter baumannii ABNIH4]